ncbi:hypothetical protein BH09PSE6_BH09PSE6_07680 [soil metagenome]
MNLRAGSVCLVGAGPGDPELLTLKAVRVIAAADVLLVDDLVDRAVLAHAAAGARIVGVGKRGGCRSTPQAFINRLLISEARAGHRVVRLKGGDPFMFGRGGEEVDACRAAGIEVSVVPGVTSALAAAAAIGSSLTHRDHSQGCIFVTGHARGDGAGREPDWRALAATGLTLVIYMGLARLDSIASALLSAGLPCALPACAVSHASSACQHVCRSSIGTLSRDVQAAGLASPAIIIVGEVAASQARTLAEVAMRAAS